jgi:hypothetical protein
VDDQSNKLLRLTRKDLNAGAVVLGRAFAEYELYRYYFQDETERRAIAVRLSFVGLSICLKYGEVYAAPAKMEGISGWLPPGKAPFGWWQIIRSVPLPVLFSSEFQKASRLGDYGRYIDNLHRKLVPYPHWSLSIIGVDPAYQ